MNAENASPPSVTFLDVPDAMRQFAERLGAQKDTKTGRWCITGPVPTPLASMIVLADGSKPPALAESNTTQLQLDLFEATGLPAIPKDERPSMEHPFYAVEDGDTRKIVYEHNGDKIEIIPSVEGRATQHDKDIVLFCLSKLVAGINRNIPVSRTIETTAHELLQFTRSSTSARGYKLLDSAFNRLTGTRMRTTVVSGKGKAKTGKRDWFGMLDRVQVVTRGPNERMEAVRITVSDFTYDAALAMEVLTIPSEYFELRSAIAKRVYELCRKHCGEQGKWKISLELLQKKVGSRQPMFKFRAAIKKLQGTLLGYELVYDEPEDAVIFYNHSEAGMQAMIGAARSKLLGKAKPRSPRPARKRAVNSSL